MKKLLWISLFAPYDNANHAGGKNENFYLKSLNNRQDINLKLLTFGDSEIADAVADDYKKYNLDGNMVRTDCGIKQNFWLRLLNIFSKFNIFSKYGGFCPVKLRKNVLSNLKKYRKSGYEPDVIILEWTQIGLLIKNIKKIFPRAKIFIMEEDVAFLGLQRRIGFTTGIKHFVTKIKYRNLKKTELESLTVADRVLVNNFKDLKLLVNSNIGQDKISVIPVYFDNYGYIERQKPNNDIIFLGAMAREENWRSMVWLIEKVLCRLNTDINLVILGSHPNENLLRYQSDRIKIMGFVKDVTPYFANSLCFAAPLVLGAGIKVKNIEALSSGIPLLTNDIGIEGIPAENGVSYFHCSQPEEYINIITKLYNGEFDFKLIEKNEKKLVKESFDCERGAETLYNLVVS